MDSIPHPSSAMGGYPSSGYPAPPHQYPSSSQYAHYGSGGHSATGMPPPPPPPPPPHRSMMGSSGGGSGSHGPGTPGSVGGDIGSATPSQSMDGYQVGMCERLNERAREWMSKYVCVCISLHRYEGNLAMIIKLSDSETWHHF